MTAETIRTLERGTPVEFYRPGFGFWQSGEFSGIREGWNVIYSAGAEFSGVPADNVRFPQSRVSRFDLR